MCSFERCTVEWFNVRGAAQSEAAYSSQLRSAVVECRVWMEWSLITIQIYIYIHIISGEAASSSYFLIVVLIVVSMCCNSREGRNRHARLTSFFTTLQQIDLALAFGGLFSVHARFGLLP